MSPTMKEMAWSECTVFDSMIVLCGCFVGWHVLVGCWMWPTSRLCWLCRSCWFWFVSLVWAQAACLDMVAHRPRVSNLFLHMQACHATVSPMHSCWAGASQIKEMPSVGALSFGCIEVTTGKSTCVSWRCRTFSSSGSNWTTHVFST